MTELNRAAILGSGTMGPGMGVVLARAGLRVALYDVNPDAIERAKTTANLVEGVLDNLAVTPRGDGGVRYETDLDAALAGVEIVIEAVPEQLELKQRVLVDVEGRVGADTIFASNTSGIPITRMAEPLARPDRLVGWHWSNPPHLIPMNEVIPGERTAPAVTEAVEELTRRIGYHP